MKIQTKWLFNIVILVVISLTILVAKSLQTPPILQNFSKLGSNWLLENVNIISIEDGQILTNQNIWIEAGFIKCIGVCAQVPKNVKRIDTKGKYVIPGLIDAHVHVNDVSELAAYLTYGVTAIRNMGGYPFHLRLQQNIKSHSLLGPSFITTGPILNSNGPNENVIQTIVNSPAQAKAEVRRQFDAGFEHVKVYSNLHPDVFAAIVATASELNMIITGHSPEGRRHIGMPYNKPFDIAWEQSLGRGFDTLEHVETIVWHGLRDDLDLTKMETLAKQLKLSGEAVTPTLIAHRRLINLAQSKGAYIKQKNSAMLNPLVSWANADSVKYWSEMNPVKYELPHAEFFLKATGILHNSGVVLLTGSDAGGFALIPGKSLHEEMALLQQSGLTQLEVLQTATINPARVLKFEKLGLIKEGYIANLLVVNNNPLESLTHIESPDIIFIHGRWLNKERLNQLREVAKKPSFWRTLFNFIEMKLE
jgi:hypothetical protein